MSTTTLHRRQGLSTPSLPLLWGMLAFLAFSLGGGDAFDAETMNFCSLRMGADPDLSEQECTRRLTTMIPDRLCLHIAGGTDEEIDWPTCIDITVLQAQIRAFQKRRQAPRAGECLDHVYILRLAIYFAPLSRFVVLSHGGVQPILPTVSCGDEPSARFLQHRSAPRDRDRDHSRLQYGVLRDNQ